MVIVASLAPDATLKDGDGTSTVNEFPEIVVEAIPVPIPLILVGGKDKV
jgi:hypothetical protein